MARRVPKLPGRGLPPSQSAASLPPGVPPPTFTLYHNRLRNTSSATTQLRLSFRKGCRVPGCGRSAPPGAAIPAAFPERRRTTTTAARRTVTSPRRARPAPGVRPPRPASAPLPASGPRAGGGQECCPFTEYPFLPTRYLNRVYLKT